MAGVAALLERSRKNGAMSAAPLGLVANMLTAVAEATVDFIIFDPANADAHQATRFDAMWRMIS